MPLSARRVWVSESKKSFAPVYPGKVSRSHSRNISTIFSSSQKDVPPPARVLPRDPAPEDLLREQRALSLRLMSDPITDISKEEVDTFTLPLKNDKEPEGSADKSFEGNENGTGSKGAAQKTTGEMYSPLSLVHSLYNLPERFSLSPPRDAFRAETFSSLLAERVENKELSQLLQIDLERFNEKAYFLLLHCWVIQRRLLLEGPDGEALVPLLQEAAWRALRVSILQQQQQTSMAALCEKGLTMELPHAQASVLQEFFDSLDDAVDRPDILPARLRNVLRSHIFGAPRQDDEAALDLMTKYAVRQLAFVLQIDKAHLLAGAFVWADFPVQNQRVTQTQKGRQSSIPPSGSTRASTTVSSQQHSSAPSVRSRRGDGWCDSLEAGIFQYTGRTGLVSSLPQSRKPPGGAETVGHCSIPPSKSSFDHLEWYFPIFGNSEIKTDGPGKLKHCFGVLSDLQKTGAQPVCGPG